MKWLRNRVKETVYKLMPRLNIFRTEHFWEMVDDRITSDSLVSDKAKLYSPAKIDDHSFVGDYTYIAQNSRMKKTTIGKFCSIGPNLVSGWGIHPTNGVSTSPMFYSTMCQNGTTMAETDKIIEQKPIVIGNDVFIGANVTILDGVTIGDGAVIGAGAVVSKDIPPYAIAVGTPIRILRYRFEDETIDKLMELQWWNMDDDKLPLVEKYFFDVKTFISECKKSCTNSQS